MGYAVGNEFPNVCGTYPDIVELLHLYEKLTAEYTELLKQITDTNAKLDAYMANINTMIPGWIDDATKEQQARLNALAAQLEKDMAAFTANINAVLQAYDSKMDTQFTNQDARVTAAIQSNYEWMTKQINEMKIWVEDEVFQMRTWVSNERTQLQKYTSTVVGELRDWVTDENEKLEDYLTDLDDQIIAEQVAIRAMVEAIDTRVSELSNEFIKHVKDSSIKMEEWYINFQLWYYARRYEDKKWLEAEIADMWKAISDIPESSVPVYNPIRNELTSINQAVMDIFNYGISAGGYSANDWDMESWITAEYFDGSDISAIEFTTSARNILDRGWRKVRMFSPVTGEYVWIGTAIQQVFNALNPTGTTAEEYDNAEATAETYDDKNVTAIGYLRKEWEDVQ